MTNGRSIYRNPPCSRISAHRANIPFQAQRSLSHPVQLHKHRHAGMEQPASVRCSRDNEELQVTAWTPPDDGSLRLNLGRVGLTGEAQDLWGFLTVSEASALLS